MTIFIVCIVIITIAEANGFVVSEATYEFTSMCILLYPVYWAAKKWLESKMK